MTNSMSRSLAVVVALCALSAAAQQAGLEAGPGQDRPWAKGVSKAAQARALDVFKDGNAALKESLFVKAAQKYREALEVWDHPAIHYNLALALVNLDQPVETYEHLEKALTFGAAPLDADKHDQALRYKALIEGQLARVKVACTEPGARVVMDGRELFVAPGTYEALVRSGPHSITATKEGFLTAQVNQVMPAGKVSDFKLELLTAEDLTEYRRKWSAWIPWSVLGAGAAVTLGGVVMHIGARDAFVGYDRGITGCTEPATGGCFPAVATTELKQRGELLQGLALTSYVVGGAAVVGGAVLVYLNRLMPYTVGGTRLEVTLVPTLGPDGAGAYAFFTF